MTPVPVPVLSVVTDAVSAASNAASGPGGTLDSSDIFAPASAVVTVVWVSVRSASAKFNLPEVGLFEISGPPGVPVPPENATVSGPVVMTGTSLVPVTVIVNVTGVFKSSGA